MWEASKDSAHKRKISGKKCESCRKSGIVRRVRNHLNHNTKDCRNDPKDRVITIRTGKFKTNRHMVTESNVTNRTLMMRVSSKRRNPARKVRFALTRARSDGITITGRSCEYCSTCGIKEPHEDYEGLCQTCDTNSDGGVTFRWNSNKAERLQAWLKYFYDAIPEGKHPTWKGSKPKWEQRPINIKCITCKFCRLKYTYPRKLKSLAHKLQVYICLRCKKAVSLKDRVEPDRKSVQELRVAIFSHPERLAIWITSRFDVRKKRSHAH